MSFSRGMALAAMAATALTGVTNKLGEFRLDDFAEQAADLGPLLRRMTHGRSHYAGHKGQREKKVVRQRRRNQLRRETHHRQRKLPGRYEPIYFYG